MILSWSHELSGTIELSGIETFSLVLGHIRFWGCCKIGLSAICIMGLQPGKNSGYPGLSCSLDTGNLSIFHFIPTLPWPNLGLTWDIPFASDVIIGFITCFSSLIFGSIPLSMPCTFSKVIWLELACDLV